MEGVAPENGDEGDEARRDLKLLSRHAPQLQFDSLEALRPTLVDDFLDDTEVLDGQDVVGEGTDIGERGGPTYSLDPLPELRPLNGQPRTTELLARFGSATKLDSPGACYGRVIRSKSGNAAFLQYWYFYVDNPCVIAPGRHDGDWEFAQLRVELAEDGGSEITHLTLNQHGGPETRGFRGFERPRVYVAVGSHAAYFDGRTHPRLPIADECDGTQSTDELPEIELIDSQAWKNWDGRWGVDRGPGSWLERLLGIHLFDWLLRLLNKIPAGDSPRSPERQPQSWNASRAYAQGCLVGGPSFRSSIAHPLQLLRRAARSVGRRVQGLIRFVGLATWPRVEPRVTVARIPGDRLEVRHKPSGWFVRRIHRASVVIRDSDKNQAVVLPTVKGRHSITLPIAADMKLEWQSAGYNRLRQRGRVTPTAEVSTNPAPQARVGEWSAIADLRIRLLAVAALIALAGLTIADHDTFPVEVTTFGGLAILVALVLLALPLGRLTNLKAFKALGVELELAEEAAAVAPTGEFTDEDEEEESTLAAEAGDPEKVIDLQLRLEAKLAYVAKHIVGLRNSGFWSGYVTIGSLEYDGFLGREDAIAARRLLSLKASDVRAAPKAAVDRYIETVEPFVRNVRATVFNRAVGVMLKEEFGVRTTELDRGRGKRPDLLVEGTTEKLLVFPAFVNTGAFWTTGRIEARASDLANSSAGALIVVPPGAPTPEFTGPASKVKVIALDALLERAEEQGPTRDQRDLAAIISGR